MRKFLLTYGVGAVLGAAAGFAYWYFIGCIDGCAIWSNPYKSTGWGAVIGALSLATLSDFRDGLRKNSASS